MIEFDQRSEVEAGSSFPAGARGPQLRRVAILSEDAVVEAVGEVALADFPEFPGKLRPNFEEVRPGLVGYPCPAANSAQICERHA